MKKVVRSLAAVVCLLFALSGCRTSSPTFTYTPLMQTVREKALAGDVVSMRKMATYHWCMSDSCNRREACLWLEQAGNTGDAMSSELAGWCYLIGRGVEKDKDAAARYFEQAADQYWMRWALIMNGHRNGLWGRMVYEDGGFRGLNDFSNSEVLYSIVDNYNRAIYLGRNAASHKKQLVLGGFSESIRELDREEAKSRGKRFDQYLADQYSRNISAPLDDKPSRGESTPIGYQVAVEGEYSYWKVVTYVWLYKFLKDTSSPSDRVLELARIIKGLESSPDLGRPMPIPVEIKLPNQYLELLGIGKELKSDEDYWSLFVTPVYVEGSDQALSAYYSTFARSDWRKTLMCVLYNSLQRWREEKGVASCREILARVLAEADLTTQEKNFLAPVRDDEP